MVMVSGEPSVSIVSSVIEHISEVHLTAYVSTTESVGSTERVMEVVVVDDIVRTGTPGTIGQTK